jgi:hypothetical protein
MLTIVLIICYNGGRIEYDWEDESMGYKKRKPLMSVTREVIRTMSEQYVARIECSTEGRAKYVHYSFRNDLHNLRISHFFGASVQGLEVYTWSIGKYNSKKIMDKIKYDALQVEAIKDEGVFLRDADEDMELAMSRMKEYTMPEPLRGMGRGLKDMRSDEMIDLSKYQPDVGIDVIKDMLLNPKKKD